MKLYQGTTTTPCYQPDSGDWAPIDLFAHLVEGTQSQDRLGNKIRVWRIDINLFVENNPLQVIPEENIQMLIYKTKTYLSGGAPANYSTLFLRPPGTIATVGPSPSLGGTDGTWIPRMWVLNPSWIPRAKVVAVKNFTIHCQGSTQVAGTSTPNLTAISAAASININTPKRYRHFGKYIYNFKRGMNVLFEEDSEDAGATYIPPNKTGADNHIWIAGVGEEDQ